MARPKKDKSASTETRHAFDGPQVEADELISFISDRNREDSERASDAGESRASIGQFLERTGVNKKAFSWGRQIVKQKKATDQADIIRSMKFLIPILEQHLLGNQPELDLPSAPSTMGGNGGEPLEPFTDELPGPSYDEDDSFLGELPDEAGDPDIQQEADDFEAALAGVEE